MNKRRLQITKRLEKEFVGRKPWPKRCQPDKVVRTRTYRMGYRVETVLIDNLGYMGFPRHRSSQKNGRWMFLDRAMTLDGLYVGDRRMGRFLFIKTGLTKVQLAQKNHNVCSIGWSEEEQKWYGWSHRAICGFGLGDKLFSERYQVKHPNTLFTESGTEEIFTNSQAKLAAKRFASSVS